MKETVLKGFKHSIKWFLSNSQFFNLPYNLDLNKLTISIKLNVLINCFIRFSNLFFFGKVFVNHIDVFLILRLKEYIQFFTYPKNIQV